MLNVKQTLKNLHKKFPTLGLDELFEVLDCYVEEYTLNTRDWEPKIWYSSDKSTNINSITSKNVDPAICTIANHCANGEIKYYDGGGSTQLVAKH